METINPPHHVRETRFRELGFRMLARDLWRIVDRSTNAEIGPQYKTRSELLQDLERFAREFGVNVPFVNPGPIETTFRIVKFLPSGRYIGIAWNYDAPVMVTTADYPDYAGARAALEIGVKAAGACLRWFDGEYVRHPGSDLMVSV